MLRLSAAPYDTPATVLFLRVSVMAGDALLMAGVIWQTAGVFGGGGGCGSVTPRGLAILLVVFSPGLLMVDHVHFQAGAYTRPLSGYLSTFCGIRWMYCVVSVTKTAYVELKSDE